MSAPVPSVHGAGTPPRRGWWLFGWLHHYPRAALTADVVAGLTAAAVVLPKAMAYATVAGLSVQVGISTAFLPPIVYSALGRSRVLSVSTTTTLAILTGSALAAAVPGGDAARLTTAAGTLSVLVGCSLILAAVLRLGFVATFISEPVLAGFKAGIGAVIVVDQVPKLLGVHIEKAGFFRDVARIVRALGQASLVTVLVSVAAVAVILGLKRWLPRVPAALVAVALGIAASPFLGVKVIGTIPAALPPLTWPDLSLVEALWPAAVAIALMSFTESIAAGRAFTGPDQERPSPNRELVATGAASLVGGLTGAMPAGGGTSQTLVNQRAGARTQLANLIVGPTALATLLLLAPMVSRLPEAVLAAIVVVYSAELLDLRDFKAILAIRRREFWWAVVAFGGVLLLGTLKGILIAVMTSLVWLAYQASHPAVYEVVRKPGTNVFRRRSGEHPEDESYPSLLMLRVEGRIFFGNAERVLELIALRARALSSRVVALDCSVIFDLEYSGLKMLDEAERRFAERGGELWLVSLNPRARRVVERSPLGRRLGRARMFFDLEHAVAVYRARGG
jgi:high affinity sulfate transporter 1